jgi:FKBP12-rapamycin complex-associated protein
MEADIPPSALVAQMQLEEPAIMGAPPSTRSRARTNSSAQGANGDADVAEAQNERAVQVLSRVKEKLTGLDFKTVEELTYIAQVDRLLIEATKLENLCQHYIGWCSFW